MVSSGYFQLINFLWRHAHRDFPQYQVEYDENYRDVFEEDTLCSRHKENSMIIHSRVLHCCPRTRIEILVQDLKDLYRMRIFFRIGSYTFSYISLNDHNKLCFKTPHASCCPPKYLLSAILQLMTFQIFSTYAAFPFRYCK